MKIKIGKIKDEIKETQTYNKDKNSLCCLGEVISIERHSWDCGWYWGFGYIGNRNLHTHAKIFIDELLWSDVNEVFEENIFKTDDNFWIFKDLLVQAYALKETAEVYKNGGHCVLKKGLTDVIQSDLKYEETNKDLEIVLNKLWGFLSKLNNANKVTL